MRRVVMAEDSKNYASGFNGQEIGADIQSKIGHQLKAIYDDVLDQPVPDRLAGLLRQLERASSTGTGRERG